MRLLDVGGLYIVLAVVAHNAAPVQAKAFRKQSAKAMSIAYKIAKMGDKGRHHYRTADRVYSLVSST